MNTMSFIFGLYTVTAIVGFGVYLTRTYVAQRNLKAMLAQATEALLIVNNMRNQVGLISEKVDKHDSKLNGLALKVGWEK